MAQDIRSKVVLGIDVNEFRRGITQVDSSIKGMSKQFQDLGGLIGATFAVSQIQQFASESLDLAMKAEGIATAFERIGNEANMAELRKSVQGTVSDLELMRQAVTAEKLGIPIQEFTKYLGFAKKQANEMGESVDYMVDSIVKGVGRQSTMILDNLGISAKAVQEELKKGGTFAEAVGRIIQQEMGGANNTLLTTQDRLLQQKATLENIKTEVGKNLMPLYLGFLEGVNSLLKGINVLWNEQFSLIDKIAYWATYLDPVNGELNRMVMEAKAAGREAAVLGNNAAMVGEGFQTAADNTKKLGDELRKLSTINVAGGLTLKDIEKQNALQPKDAAPVPLYQTNQAVFGIVRQAEYAAGSLDVFNASMVKSTESTVNWAAQLQMANWIGQEFGMILSSSFDAAIIRGENFFKVMVDGLKAYIAKMIAAAAATAALAIAIVAVTGQTQNFATAFQLAGKFTGFGIPDLGGGSSTLSGRDIKLSYDRNNFDFARNGGK